MDGASDVAELAARMARLEAEIEILAARLAKLEADRRRDRRQAEEYEIASMIG